MPENTKPQNPNTASEPQDIFAEADGVQQKTSTTNPQMPQPLTNPVQTTPSSVGQMPLKQDVAMPKPSRSRKGIKVFLIVIVVFGIIGGGTYGAYWYMESQDQVTMDQQEVEVPETVVVNTNTSAVEVITQNPVVREVDTDQDGLSDEEEKKYKTDPKKVDSDDDGLSDYIEVMTYKTDPNVSDTDKDGYDDGEEIMGGYNPKGEGTLIDVATAQKNE